MNADLMPGAPAASSAPFASLTPAALDTFPLEEHPRCPTLMIPYQGSLYALRASRLEYTVEVQLGMAFVVMRGVWKNMARHSSDCMFTLPLQGTVSSVEMRVGPRLYDTLVLPRSIAQQMRGPGPADSSAPNSPAPLGSRSIPPAAVANAPAGAAPAAPRDVPSPHGHLVVPVNAALNGGGGSLAVGEATPDSSSTNSAMDRLTGNFEMYVPGLFRMPVPAVKSGDEIVVTVKYFEPLSFENGQYHLSLRLTFDSTQMETGRTLRDILRIRCAINSTTDRTQFGSSSHDLRVVDRRPGRTELEVVNIGQQPAAGAAGAAEGAGSADAARRFCSPTQSVDFDLSYSLATERVSVVLLKGEPTRRGRERQGSALPAGALPAGALPAGALPASERTDETAGSKQQPGEGEDEPNGAFCLFLAPPSTSAPYFHRRMVILLDRSGSMAGEPFVEATRALAAALENLKPDDEFTLVLFDHTMEIFSETLLPATRYHTDRAAVWVAGLSPKRGGTDISAPLKWAVGLLNRQSGDTRALPLVMLLTDGCVDNEREICQFARETKSSARILTFAIGIYSNWFFLRMLSQIGRGMFALSVFRERLYSQMSGLLNMSAFPVVTNLGLGLDSSELREVSLFPDPIPDLYMGAPVAVAGRFSGRFPSSATVSGLLGDSVPFSTEVPVEVSTAIPIRRLLLGQQLELLTARAWLDRDTELEEQVVHLSCNEMVPSAYTTMVSFETTEWRRNELRRLRGHSMDEAAGAIAADPDAEDVLRRLAEEDEYDLDDDDIDFGDDDAAGPAAGAAGAAGTSRSSGGAGGAGDHRSRRKPSRSLKWYQDRRRLAALVAGSVTIVGATAFSFGDAGATLLNLPGVSAGVDSIAHCCDGSCCSCGGGCGCLECLQC